MCLCVFTERIMGDTTPDQCTEPMHFDTHAHSCTFSKEFFYLNPLPQSGTRIVNSCQIKQNVRAVKEELEKKSHAAMLRPNRS